MILLKKHISCNGCGRTLWNDDLNKSATKFRAGYKKIGWRLIVGDGFIYGDYCPECVSKQAYKTPKQ